MTTGERIRTRRIELGLTQLEVAKKLGYTSKAAICKIEKQGNNVTLKTVIKIAKVLNCSPSYLMGWEDIEEPKVAKVSDTVKDINTLASQLDQSSQERLLAYAQGMYDIQNQDKKGGIAHVETKG